MNLQYTKVGQPIRVLVVNPLLPASQLLITKLLSGIIFGMNDFIDLILLVYLNEMKFANEYVQDLTSCAFPCFNTIRATSDLPSIRDADVFCIMTNFVNPNKFDFYQDSDEQFDSLYLALKIAFALGKPLVGEALVESKKKTINKNNHPIIVCDGFIIMDVLNSFCENIPSKVFYCATPLRSIAKTILSDYLKVECRDINDAYVWAVNDVDFHVEIATPYLIYDNVRTGDACDWDGMGKEVMEKLKLDHVRFNASFMKREFIEKVALTSKENPYGCIYRAAEVSKTIRYIWQSRSDRDEEEVFTSLGVISDGSLGTPKGLPYVLPLIIRDQQWTVNKRYEESSHLRNEIKRINQIAKDHHFQLYQYCKKFVDENITKHAFLPDTQDSESEDSFYNMGFSTRTSDT
ncbi:unnamed protein product [Chrysodeixis includens]|uniref:Uncharacterized protein n=1 Tax=Chrysodeixis includens TaxID=689277 RepID=A0A9P0BHY1_CHRIL|nr:unnamed protein product [Chrysodeixis includens]